LLYALGEDPGVVMDEMGHADWGRALSVYRQAMHHGEDEKAALQALIEGSRLVAPSDLGSAGRRLSRVATGLEQAQE